MMHLLEAPIKWLEKFGINGAIVLSVVGGFFVYVILSNIEVPTNSVIRFMVLTAPIWLPIITFTLFFDTWLYYVQTFFNMTQGRVTLEIRLPQEIFKSPEAMELVLNQLHQPASPDNHVQTYWDGKNPPTYSLELVSRGGDVRFYMNVPRKKFKNLTEAQLYSQYPGIEVKELDIDYTAEIPWNPDKYNSLSFHFGLRKEDPLPIKTYIDYGLLDMPKEEEKVDPITSMLDTLANLGPGEYYWVQILITMNREVGFKEGSLKTKPDWKEGCRKKIKEIMDIAKVRAGGDTGNTGFLLLTDTEKDTIKSIERSVGKSAFDTKIRGIYIATVDCFNPGERIGPFLTGWKNYEDHNRNSIGPLWRTDFDWNWWQDPSGKRRLALKKEELHEYKLRKYTQHGKKDGAKVMTTEELATVFHFPGKVAITPTLARIPSARGEAPPNLPTG
jgi:hypothetical protein